MAHHHLKASPETCHWGWFDAAMKPAMTIASGDRVTVETVSGAPEDLPGEGYHIPPELLDIHKRSERRMPGHLLTGPIAVEGAMPGDVLEIRLLDIKLRQDWGYTKVRPLAGALPEDFDEPDRMTVDLDAERNVGRLPWGTELPLRPFFGVIGVAPPAGWGAISTIQPRKNGGNLDNKELIAGTTLYLPVWTEGGKLSLGDGHGVQGDGEVCVTAIETALEGEIEVHLRKDLSLDYPRAETPDARITMGMNADLDNAASHALRQMIDWIVDTTNLSRSQAFMLMSLAADVRVTQLVNQEKGIHVVLPKSALGAG
ncbi:acetamidase/formamidase family protein [Thalassobaculum sp. OXR-137]|uniref:acetamidase/formamidase family protein n=1 Tax=Thalassobaculum sp. OXR-137 TaxID=3100173 RepID=UPI002AC9BB94|nr:acetamidase/formamidase family protein [Thalassobaculum sp. OXR-137]WPZ37010.1 acetamidase/formamidase family protein [Thalassobaculum sp. OXR-137]